MTLPTLQNLKTNIPGSLKCSIPSQQVKKGNKRKAKKARAKRMEANCKRVIETIAPREEWHDVTEPIGPLSLHYEGISALLKTQMPYTASYFEKGCRKKCTRQCRKALWVVLSSLFFEEI